MSLHPTEFAVVAAALSRALVGAVVQKVRSPAALRLELELRSPGLTTRLLVCAEPGGGRIAIATVRSAATSSPSPWLARLRKELVGSRLLALAPTGAREVELRFQRQTTLRTLVLEAEAPGALLLLGEGRRPLAASGERARAPRKPTPIPPQEPASRLPALTDALELGRAVEALFAGKEDAVRAAALRRQLVQPLRTRVARLRRTVEKVRAEANRADQAEEHRRFGELLRQNASAVPRGATEVTLTEYSVEGARPVSVPLDPALDARAHA